MERVTAIILAAGKGSRMLSETPKQFMEISGRPLIYYSLKTFDESMINDIVVVTNEQYMQYCWNIIEQYQIKKIKTIVHGGSERYWSVLNGLKACAGTEYVLIHDAARPCVTEDMIKASIEEVRRCGACTVGVPVKDTIKVVNEKQEGIDTPPREKLWLVQTPQSFKYEDILLAYGKMEQSGDTDITDDTMIIERYLGRTTKMVQGDYCNIKVTTPEDLMLAENFLKKCKKLLT